MKSYKISALIIFLALFLVGSFACAEEMSEEYNIFGDENERIESIEPKEKKGFLSKVKNLFKSEKDSKEPETIFDPNGSTNLLDKMEELQDLESENSDTKKAEISKMEVTKSPAGAFEYSDGDDVDLKSDNVEFYPEVHQFIAVGNAVLSVHSQKFKMTADEIIFGQLDNSIVGVGNVKIYKDDNELTGDYIKIDAKKENAFFRKPILHFNTITVKAKTANVYSNVIDAYDGTMELNQPVARAFTSTAVGNLNLAKLYDPDLFENGVDKNYRITAKEIVVKRDVDRTVTTIKNASVYRNNLKVGIVSNVEISSDKNMKHIETNFIEMGKRPRTDPFIAPSLVFQLPKGSTLKAGPLFSWGGSNGIGIGGFGRLYTEKSKTELYYSSARDYMVLNGKYNFTPDWQLQYTLNDYLNNGFMGSQMPEYGVELAYDKATKLSDIGVTSRNRITGGYFKDFERPNKSMRLKWQSMNSSKPLVSWEEYLQLGLVEQHDISYYEAGNLVSTFRAGPYLRSSIGRFNARLFYFMGGTSGESPMYFDRYRYGKQNVQLMLQYYVNKYLTLAYYGSVTPMRDNWQREWLTENQIIVSAGTEDVKLRFGFDLIRNMSVVGFDFLLGSDKTKIDFDKMRVIDYDKAGRGKKKETKPSSDAKQNNETI